MGLKEIRISKGMNQKQMAEKIGVSASYYYKIESGMRNPSFEFLVKLKTVFPQINIDKVIFTKNYIKKKITRC